MMRFFALLLLTLHKVRGFTFLPPAGPIASAKSSPVKTGFAQPYRPSFALYGGKNAKEGPFSPVVKATRAVMGAEELTKLRGKVIAEHSKVRKGSVVQALNEAPATLSALLTPPPRSLPLFSSLVPSSGHLRLRRHLRIKVRQDSPPRPL